MRGTRPFGAPSLFARRFIPASAGNTHRSYCRSWPQAVHPRECGEHSSRRIVLLPWCGSSPRVRGTHARRQRNAGVVRFIPASAGNTAELRVWLPARPVHPRECGEHVLYPDWHADGRGSSPRVRGTPLPARHVLGMARFIPASAGNTWKCHAPSRCRTVHPRECGEHSVSAATTFSDAGSSPRVRGTPPRRSRSIPRRRFIPASAGNTSLKWPHTEPSTVHPRECGEHACASPK